MTVIVLLVASESRICFPSSSILSERSSPSRVRKAAPTGAPLTVPPSQIPPLVNPGSFRDDQRISEGKQTRGKEQKRIPRQSLILPYHNNPRGSPYHSRSLRFACPQPAMRRARNQPRIELRMVRIVLKKSRTGRWPGEGLAQFGYRYWSSENSPDRTRQP